MHVAIVEPHYDDAWLSLGATILAHPHVRFTIVTVSKDDVINPIDRTRLLAERLENVTTLALELRDLGWKRDEALARARKAGKQDLVSLFLHESALASLDEVAGRIETIGADRVALPLGLFHPMHEVVAALPVRGPVLRYLEYPYRFYEDVRPALEARSSGLSAWRLDASPFAKMKLRTFEEVYATQRFVLELAEVPLAAADEILLAGDPRMLPPW
ncbi:MAG: hypothetical protein IT378_26375 [Sandaracinaceae bacterium]|nr:hypothetical protein [Sandaracinaceae bacterium]